MKIAVIASFLIAATVSNFQAAPALTLPKDATLETAAPAQLSAAVGELPSMSNEEVITVVANVFSAWQKPAAKRKEAAAVISAFAKKFPDQILAVVVGACRQQPAMAPIVAAAATGELPKKSKEIAEAARAAVSDALAKNEKENAERLKLITEAIDLAVAGALKSGPIDAWAWTAASGARSGYVGAPFLNPANFQAEEEEDDEESGDPEKKSKRSNKKTNQPVVSPSN